MFLCILHTCGSLRYIDPPNYNNSVGLTGASYRQAGEYRRDQQSENDTT